LVNPHRRSPSPFKISTTALCARSPLLTTIYSYLPLVVSSTAHRHSYGHTCYICSCHYIICQHENTDVLSTFTSNLLYYKCCCIDDIIII
jgi:hypothetical protein